MRHPVHMGMALFLAAESVLFLMFLLAFAYFREVRTGSANLELGSAMLSTAFLFSACIAMSQAVAWSRKAPRVARLSIVSAMLFGAAFVLARCREYWRLLSSGVTISRSLFGTTFFTLTGVHLLHVFAGLLLLGVLTALGADATSPALQAAAMFWYFLGAVWVAIFIVVYLRILP